MQRLGVRVKLGYVAPSFVAWAGIYAAGVHPTIAGVIVGLVTPVRAWLGPDGFVHGVRRELEHLGKATTSELSSHGLAQTLRHVDVARREAMSPAESLIESLHPWLALGIMPVFALANAGVSLSGGAVDEVSIAVITAVGVGLIVGKSAGVLLASWLTLRLRIGTLPAGMSSRHLAVLGVVASVGFTMALFIAQLAFTDARRLRQRETGSGCGQRRSGDPCARPRSGASRARRGCLGCKPRMKPSRRRRLDDATWVHAGTALRPEAAVAAPGSSLDARPTVCERDAFAAQSGWRWSPPTTVVFETANDSYDAAP